MLFCPRAMKAQLNPSLLSSPDAQFNIFCDPNGGGTGQCRRLDDNTQISCQYASQDFIQCQQPNRNLLSICVNFAPWQYACKANRNVQLNQDGSCKNSLDSSSNCRSPLKKGYTDQLNALPDTFGITNMQPLPGQSDFDDVLTP